MEIPENLIIKYFELATDEHPDDIDRIRLELERGANPRDIKYRLAKIITSLYHSKEEVEKAIGYYDAAFSKKSIPDNIPSMLVDTGKDTVNDVIPRIVDMELVKSRSEFLRLIRQGGVRLNGEKIDEEDLNRILIDSDVIKIGKKTFLKIEKK